MKDWALEDIKYLLDMEPYLDLLRRNGIQIEHQPGDFLKSHMTRATWVKSMCT